MEAAAQLKTPAAARPKNREAAIPNLLIEGHSNSEKSVKYVWLGDGEKQRLATYIFAASVLELVSLP
jgi:hypothetical protein